MQMGFYFKRLERDIFIPLSELQHQLMASTRSDGLAVRKQLLCWFCVSMGKNFPFFFFSFFSPFLPPHVVLFLCTGWKRNSVPLLLICLIDRVTINFTFQGFRCEVLLRNLG